MKFFTVEEVSEILKVKTQVIYRWIREGKLKAFKVGGKSVRVKEEDLMDIIKEVK